MSLNLNIQPSFGDLHISFITGRAAEYLGAGDLLDHIISLASDSSIIEDFEKAVASVPTWETKSFPSLWSFRSFRVLLHGLVRDYRPKHVVETGILHGMTSAFILEAISLNGFGQLTSIDLPSYADVAPSNQDGYNDTLPPGQTPGWIVPERLHDYWDLRLGSSRQLLPILFDELDSIDIFIHDSEHSYKTMWFELNAAWDKLRVGGLLVCDNIESNTSFFDFCRRVNRLPLVLPAPSTDRAYQPRFALIVR